MKSKGPGHPQAFAAALQSLNAELLDRLQYFALEPSCVLDLGAGEGQASVKLRQRYRDAQVIAIDCALAMLQASPKSWWPRARFHRVAADAMRLPFPDHSVDLVYSNLLLPLCDRPDLVFAEVARVLREGALFIFSSLGPDTLRELREAWERAGDGAQVRTFLSLPVLGDALIHCGLAEPVMDTEQQCLHYPDVHSLLRELSASSTQRAIGGRAHSPTGTLPLRRMIQVYESARTEAGIPATFEVIFGAAFAGGRGTASLQHDHGEIAIPIGSVKKRVR